MSYTRTPLGCQYAALTTLARHCTMMALSLPALHSADISASLRASAQPFAAAFDALKLPWSEWDMSQQTTIDLSSSPPLGVFYNRMSASSHTRDHRYCAELTVSVLSWLQRHHRIVINGSGALDLEINKVRQYSQLEAAGLQVPRTILVPIHNIATYADSLVAAAERFFPTQPFILKPNRGGKGFGVHLFARPAQLRTYLGSEAAKEEVPVDGQWLLQQYIKAEPAVIVRMEFVGGRFLYAVEVDTSTGFLLCPADECQTAVGDALCPAPSASAPPPSVAAAPSKFTVLSEPPAAHAALIPDLERFLASSGVHVAGVEVIRDESGAVYPYDVNTNTNYNPAAEDKAAISGTSRSGPGALALFLRKEWEKIK